MAIELIKFIGCILSFMLVFSALYIRFCRKIDTLKLSVDWSLMLIAGAGTCLFTYFINLTEHESLTLRASLIVTACTLYISALIIWFLGSKKSTSKHKDDCKC